MAKAPKDVDKKDMAEAAARLRELFTDVEVRDMAEMVYRLRLEGNDAERMVAKDGDGGEKLRSRAGSYDSLVRDVMKAALLSGVTVE